MAHHHEGESDSAVQATQHSPTQVLDHRVVFVLTHTVISVQMDVHLSKAVRLKEVVEHADDGVRPLPNIHRLVDELVNLPWDGLTTHPKESTLSGRAEIDRPGLEGVRRIVHLLGHVKTVVHGHLV